MIPFTTTVREPTSPTRELAQLQRLAGPLAVANLGQVLLGAVDTGVVGRLGSVELGAGGLGSSLFFTVAVVGTGVMLGFDPLIAQALGAGEPGRARSMLGRAIWLGIVGALPLIGVGLLLGGSLEWLGIASDTAAHTRGYLGVRLIGLVPYLTFVATRSYLQATQQTRPVVMGVVLANLINLPVSWVLALGDTGLVRVGLPPIGLAGWGVVGAAWASVIATAIQMLVLLGGVWRWGVVGSALLDREVTSRALRLGAPIGLTLLAEYGVFSLVNLLMGNLDAESLAAHQVAITFAAATFSISLGVGAAAAVRVGRAVGAGDAEGTRLSGIMAIALGGGLMVLPAIVLWAIPTELAALVTDRPEVIATAAPLLRVAAFFQLSDGVQAVAAGALRGAGATRFPLLANLLGHYGVGLPLGALLAFGCGWGAEGLWWGLSAGLAGVAVALVWRFVALTRARVVPV